MRDLTKSVASASWALSLLGAQQFLALLSPETWRRPGAAARPMQSVTGAARQQLGGSLGSAFDVGDRVQRGMVDVFFGMLGPLDPQRAMGRNGDCGDCGDGGGAEAGGGWGPMPPEPPGGE